MKQPHSIEELEDLLSAPTSGVLEALSALKGDVMVLGAGGKMGPSLARMVRRGLDALGHSHRRVIAVSRFSSPAAAAELVAHGVETIPCDLLNLQAVQKLPVVPNVIFMAGQKFGTSEAPDLTWAMNTIVPAHVAQHFTSSRIAVFSTGCVYPLVPLLSSGAREEEPLNPPGEYAASCVGRERIFEYYSRHHDTPVLLFRLCYANDLRYGVLVDVARKVQAGQPIDVTMGAANVIWQGDASARAIQSLLRASAPPVALNVTGREHVPIRWLAQEFGRLLGREPVLTGTEGELAWIWDASRSYEWFGPPTVTLEEMIDATALWVKEGGATLGKPTHFEATDGRF